MVKKKMQISLKDNTIFIADSHYSIKKKTLLTLLKKIDEDKSLDISQIFLMGDIFDFLSSDIDYFIQSNRLAIDIINKISKDIPIVYFEGNHDFNLNDIFPNVLVIDRRNQPISIEYNQKLIKLSHGDIYTPYLYNLYTSLIRNRILLKFINMIDINHWFTKYIYNMLERKNICKKFDNFDKVIEERLIKYDANLVIEGHFHQEVLRKEYINIPSLYCDRKYLLFRDDKFSFIKI